MSIRKLSFLSLSSYLIGSVMRYLVHLTYLHPIEALRNHKPSIQAECSQSATHLCAIYNATAEGIINEFAEAACR